MLLLGIREVMGQVGFIAFAEVAHFGSGLTIQGVQDVVMIHPERASQLTNLEVF